MNVLSLAHAQLNVEGLSPVSCERADSLVGTWSKDLKWNIDAIHTNNTKWRGIWPNGEGLNVNIIHQQAPRQLMMEIQPLFSTEIKTLLKKKLFTQIVSLIVRRISKRIRTSLSERGSTTPDALVKAKKWGQTLLNTNTLQFAKYDFIFASVGYGDEYLLQTALTISEKLKVPMIVDFRDLWSEHHGPSRFTDTQRQRIHILEKKLLIKTVMISVPQKHMAYLLRKWVTCPVYFLSHSAYVGDDWEDGKVTNDEFSLLYAGKLYANAPGLKMLMEFLQKLSKARLYKQVKCHFFVDDTALLRKFVDDNNIKAFVSINEWVSPSELWKRTRSAHLLLVPDPGLAEHYPLISTKTFQLAYTGRQILCLSKYENKEMEEFLNKYDAGIITTNIDEAVTWASKLSFEKGQYEHLPGLRNILQRGQAAIDFGKEIEKIMSPTKVL